MTQPIPVIPLEYAKASPRPPWVWRVVLAVCHALALLCCAVAWWLIAFEDVTSVVFTGPVLSALGVLMIVGGLIGHDRWAAAFGAAHVAVCLLFFLLVNLRGWSPDEAHAPFTAMGAAYTFTATAIAATSWFRRWSAGTGAGVPSAWGVDRA